MLVLACPAGLAAAAGARDAGGGDRVPVLSITHETVSRATREEVCWQTIVSDRERARREYDSKPWVVKHWKPILGGVLGGLVGFKFTRNYGEASKRKWLYPTVAAGIGVGALAGPGMVAGAYGLGSVAWHYWPQKLPLVAAVSLLGGILGDGLFEWLFPDAPSKDLLAPTQPGTYLADQQFFVETRCLPQVKVRTSESPYRVSYEWQGERRSALLKHYPGERIRLDTAGRPVNEYRP